MEIRDAQLFMKALDMLIEQSNLPLRIATQYGTEELRRPIVEICTGLIRDVDYVVRPKLISMFPELKGGKLDE
jgi:hypothetical protein